MHSKTCRAKITLNSITPGRPSMIIFFKRLHRGEEGAGLVEYGLLIVFIALIAAVGLRALGTSINSLFSNIGSSVGAAPVP